MPLPLAVPIAIAAAGALTNILSGNSAEEKQRQYQRAMQHKQEQEARRTALQSAIGARSFGVRHDPGPPDTSTERTLGALGSLAGQAGASFLGSQGAGQASPSPEGAFTDPSEAIRRRLQNSFDPYGGSRVA